MGHSPFKQWALLSLLVFLGSACGGGPAALKLSLLLPESPDPMAGVERIRIRVNGSEMAEMLTESAREVQQITVPQIPAGEDRVIAVEGLDSEGRILAWGQTATFSLQIGSPTSMTIYFSRNGQFSLAKARLAKGRYGHTVTALADGRVVVAGGRTKDGPTSSVEIFQPSSQTFVTAVPLKQPRSGHRAILIGDTVVFVGGEDSQVLKSVEIYDPNSGPLVELNLADARVGHAIAALPGSKVIVTGGESSAKALASVEIIDVGLQTISPGAPLNSSRSHHIALGFADGLVVVAGGQNTESGTSLVTTGELYRVATGGTASWTTAASLPDPRTKAVAVNLPDGRGLIVGGEDETGTAVRAAVIFDPKTETFISSDTTNAVYGSHAAVAFADGALVAGGKATKEVALLAGNFFVDGGQLIESREDFQLSPLPDGTILAIGGRDGSEIRDDAEIYNPQR